MRLGPQLLCAAVSTLGLRRALAQKECGDPPTSTTLAGPLEWDDCLELRVTLSYDEEAAAIDGRGSLGQACVPYNLFEDQSGNPFINRREDCPLHWNCVGAGPAIKACRNGLYCDTSTNTCEQCAMCNQNTDAASANAGVTPPTCGNCKTRFYLSVDEYSVIRVLDSCGQYSGQQEECELVMGCAYDAGTCLPGPVVQPGASDSDPVTISADHTVNDENTLFTPNQQFYLEVGYPGEGYGMVWSPSVVYADDAFEVISMYSIIQIVDGYPRKILWEQTKDLSPSCSPAIERVQSNQNNRSSITATCSEPPGAETRVCDLTLPGKQYEATACGFSTYAGYKTTVEGQSDPVFQRMLWPLDSSDGEENERRQAQNQCSQNMCAQAGTQEVEPLQIYITWRGTDVDGRLMSSSGLSYEAFRQFSAFEAFSAAKDAASGVLERSRRCLAAKQCD